MSYLSDLTIRLTSGIAELPEEQRARHTKWLLAQQSADGGFRGRDGASDLYYTSFGLRSLAILGELYGAVAEQAANFLHQKLASRETIVDFLSLIYSAALLESSAGIDIFSKAVPTWRDAVAQQLEALRLPDGGYAKGPGGTASSTYHSFLVLLCFEMIETTVPNPDQLVCFLLSQEVSEGGFREIRASKRAGTNPTAAAIGALKILQSITRAIQENTVDFLCEMQTDEGGFRANTRIPIADLLSSFTGFLTLIDLGGREEIDLVALQRYALSLEESAGGFRGAEWDQACDVEYTFYGLGLSALLAQ